eukprot:snap_masked-scaffold_13-processed-gene-1.41-mRNA-1 protein AED:1.00 eAED:1.00 QI:0/-1/0/0/-1/1/1/0/137
MNNILNKFYCESCDRYFSAGISLKCHKARWCDGTKNRRRTGTLAVVQAKLAIEEKSQPKADNVLVNGETVEAGKSYNFLGVEMDCQGIQVSAFISKIFPTGESISKFKNLLGSNKLQMKTRKNFARAVTISSNPLRV